MPGSGKTTVARKLNNHLNTLGIDNIFFQEGDLHPVDLAWTAIMKKDELDDLFKIYPMLENEIKESVKKINDLYYIPYTKIEINESCKNFYDFMGRYEIYQEENLENFFKPHKDLWLDFIKENKDKDQVYIFECIFLHNHINELILKFNLKDEEIISYFEEFEELFLGLNVRILYIKQENVKDILHKITEERRTNDKELYKDWIDHVIDYVENSRYGTFLGYNGYLGVEKYFFDRQLLEIKVLDSLKTEKEIFCLKNSYDKIFLEMISKLNLY